MTKGVLNKQKMLALVVACALTSTCAMHVNGSQTEFQSHREVSGQRRSCLTYLSDCAAAFGTRKQMLITSTEAMIRIFLSLVLSLVLFLVALIARYPFAAAARSPL